MEDIFLEGLEEIFDLPIKVNFIEIGVYEIKLFIVDEIIAFKYKPNFKFSNQENIYLIAKQIDSEIIKHFRKVS